VLRNHSHGPRMLLIPSLTGKYVPSRAVPRMDRIEIMLWLALILSRMNRLAGLDTEDEKDLHQTQNEINRLRKKWQELTQELKARARPIG
jgi:hypothetical protein